MQHRVGGGFGSSCFASWKVSRVKHNFMDALAHFQAAHSLFVEMKYKLFLHGT